MKLHCTTGGSDKIYFVQIKVVYFGGSASYDVYTEYGRRGGTMNSGYKIRDVDLNKAKMTYAKLVNEKRGKGYVTIEEGGAATTVVPQQQEEEVSIQLMPQLLNPIILEVDIYLNDHMYVAEEKKDGERRMIVIKDSSAKEVYGTNKKGKIVALPETVIDALDPDMYDVILDGEIIGDKYFVFDILSDEETRNKPYIMRRRELEYFRFGSAIEVVYMAVTDEEKRALYERLKAEGKEGIVFKRQNATYEAGRPASGGNQLKFKFVESCTCMVSGHTDGKRSVELQMFRPYSKEFEPGGFKSLPPKVGKVTIPPNHDMPEPGAFVEVQYLYAYKNGSLYQPVYLGQRNDCTIEDCSINQLKYKSE